MSFPLSSSDLIALVALAVSTFAAWKTIRFNERQKSLIDSQERLNKALLEKEQQDMSANSKADLGTSILKFGSDNYRLKIWNKGKAPAQNVSISFPNGNELIDECELSQKFPLERLDTYQSVELLAFVGMDTKSKHSIVLTWSDEFNAHNKKTSYLTI